MKEIPLTGGGVALVDDADYDRLSRYKWHRISGGNGVGYASRMTIEGDGHYRVLMHRELLNAPKTLEVHHVDGNSLNNQKSNLALVSREEHLGLHGDDRHIVKISVAMSASYVDALDALAKERRISRSSALREMIDFYLRHSDGGDD